MPHQVRCTFDFDLYSGASRPRTFGRHKRPPQSHTCPGEPATSSSAKPRSDACIPPIDLTPANKASLERNVTAVKASTGRKASWAKSCTGGENARNAGITTMDIARRVYRV